MSLFINIWDYIDEKKYPFNLFISQRGLGKTYSALSGVRSRIKPPESKFTLMRRTADEHEMLLDKKDKEGLNPFKTINRDASDNLACTSIAKKLGGIYHRKIENEKFIYYDQVGYSCALSNFAGVRGIDMTDSDYLIYDEFIAEKHIRAINGEGEAFLNAYETINRNREFEGKKALTAILLANSNNIYNPIMKVLGLVNTAEKMITKNQEHFYDNKRGIALHIFSSKNEFTKKKKETALYKLTNGTDFSKMALENDFVYNDFSNCGYQSTRGMRPICALDEAYIYQGKGMIYISYAQAQCQKFNTKVDSDIRHFMSIIGIYLIDIYTSGKLYAEDYNLKKKLLDIII